jgi:hypothetical protein
MDLKCPLCSTECNANREKTARVIGFEGCLELKWK